MFERILVPLDGSRLAEQVFPRVAELVWAFGSEVVLIEVCASDESQYEQMCGLYLESKAEHLRQSVGEPAFKVKTVVLIGKPGREIIGYAEKNDISLIILSSHGRSGIMPRSLGSTVDKVLRRAGVPTIIVRVEDTPVDSAKIDLFSRILVPLDGSERSTVVLPYVVELAKELKSEIILLHIVAPGRHVHTIGGLDYVPFKDQDIESMKTSAQEYLDGISSKLAGTKATVRCEVRVGDGAREIIRFAREMNCRLIAMASHRHFSLEVWIYGSISHQILQSSELSVLLVPSSGTQE